MKLERVRLDKLHLHPSNPRLHDERNIDAIKASLQAFGQQKPIIIDAKNVVLAGNGTVMAARDLGWKDIVAQRTTLKGASAIAYLIGDNRCSDLSSFDDPTLAELLKPFEKSRQVNLASIGYSQDDLDKLLHEVSETFKEGAEDPPRLDRVQKIKCPKCGHEFERYA